MKIVCTVMIFEVRNTSCLLYCKICKESGFLSTEYAFEKFIINVGPHRRIDPSNGYVFFMCEHKEGDQTEFVTTLKTKQEYVIYPLREEKNTDLINFLKEKSNDILKSTEPQYKTELDPETLKSEVITFVEQDLTPSDDTVMNFDFSGFFNHVVDKVKAVGQTIEKGLETAGEAIKQGAETVGKGIVNVAKEMAHESLATKIANGVATVIVAETRKNGSENEE